MFNIDFQEIEGKSTTTETCSRLAAEAWSFGHPAMSAKPNVKPENTETREVTGGQENRDKQGALPDTPINQPRRRPDRVNATPFGHGICETWNYPDGTREERTLVHGGYCELAHSDANGKLSVYSVNGPTLHIRRPDGSVTYYIDRGSSAFRETTTDDGSYSRENMETHAIRNLIQNYRRMIMR